MNDVPEPEQPAQPPRWQTYPDPKGGFVIWDRESERIPVFEMEDGERLEARGLDAPAAALLITELYLGGRDTDGDDADDPGRA